MSVFDHSSYKKYLIYEFGSRQRGRGSRKQLAEYLKCNTGFISQILKGQPNFSLEQALRVSHFLNHSIEEEEFFLLLVQKERAGSRELEIYFENHIQIILKKRNQIKNRIETDLVLTPEIRSLYYSSWYYGAIHMATMIPDLKNPSNISQALKIPLATVQQVLKFLTEHGLVLEENNSYKIGNVRMHIDNESPLVKTHHSNLRLQALKSMDEKHPENRHYSSIMAISRADFLRIRELILKTLSEMESIIKPSPEEELYAFGFDLFQLTQQKLS